MIPVQLQQMETGNLEMNFGPRGGYRLHPQQTQQHLTMYRRFSPRKGYGLHLDFDSGQINHLP